MMRTVVSLGIALVLAAAVALAQQLPARPMSPEGSAQTQVLGKWTKGERPSFAAGRETYLGGRWIEITYGRPLQRGRDLFGSGANYGKSLNDVGTANLPAPPVWRAGANVSTRLKSEVPLTFGAAKVPAGEYSLFIDLNSPSQWTLIISNWGAQAKFDPKDKNALWGAYGYTGRQGRNARADEGRGAALRRRSAHLELPRHDQRQRAHRADVGQDDGERRVQNECAVETLLNRCTRCTRFTGCTRCPVHRVR